MAFKVELAATVVCGATIDVGVVISGIVVVAREFDIVNDILVTLVVGASKVVLNGISRNADPKADAADANSG